MLDQYAPGCDTLMLNPTTIKEYAYSLGFDIARITTAGDFPEAERVIKERIAQGLMEGLPWFTAERCEVSCHPDALLPEAKSIITLAMFYLTEQPDEVQDNMPRGRISRYAWGDDYHEIIKPKLQQFAAWLREYARNEMRDEVETRLFVDTGRMVDRAVAQRAGLGWYGKNTNILTKGWGSWVFLAEIVTNLPLQADLPLKTSCGSCEICLHACPTKALPAPYVLDNTRCISFLTIELRGSIPLELRPLMGNCGDQRAVPALIGALQDNEALIRGHAAWALGRIGGEHAKGALHTALATEENQEVQKEIQCALAEIGSL